MSQDDLVKASGVSKGQISKLERTDGPSARELTRQWAEKFAPALRMPAERIMFWDKYGPPDDEHQDDLRSEDIAEALVSPPPPRTVKLKGYVGAGAETHFYKYADEDFETVEPPAGASDRTIAVVVKGKSWGPRMDGWLVFYDDVRSPITEDMFNQPCVVGLADDRILLKTIRREGDGSFTLLSNSDEPPIENVVIEWAAKVIGMRPRS
ncbi:phage repressor protein [Tardiphaga sp. 839_C3_N1_4]|uniref:phage repressor protein n=1 Tax=Tardiphaga sp. 839_C3_N1_4 TaxID=3240761 RepID=UPI003F279626